MSFLELVGIQKHYGSIEAVRTVDLEIREGEFLTLLGPSGCGKSTILRIVGGFEQPTAGRVLFQGNDVTAVAPDRRPFNMVFQSYALFPHMTVAENVAYGPRTAGMPRQQVNDRVRAMLGLVHLEDASTRRVGELSGGQQQRVALARTLINEPAVLLLDEPLGALDLQLRKSLQDELKAIQGRIGTTFIYVTHDQEEALALSHRVAVVEAGTIRQLGDPREIYERPASRFVAEFMGDANLIDCTVLSAGDQTVDVRFRSGASCSLPYHGGARFEPGDAALAVLRPHHLELCDDDSALFKGVVDHATFLGPYCRYDIDINTEVGARLRVYGDPDRGLCEGRQGVHIRAGHGAVVHAQPPGADLPINVRA